MMKSLEILMDEHRVIEQVLNCLEQILERCGTEGKLRQGHLLARHSTSSARLQIAATTARRKSSFPAAGKPRAR